MTLEVDSNSIKYENNKVIIQGAPKDGENISVFIRPGDEVVFDIEGVDSDELDYVLVGGDVVVEFPGLGVLTFPSMGLMSFSNNSPQFNFNGKLFSVENLLSRIEEINELPITSVDASFKVRVSDTDEDKGLLNDNKDKASPVQIVIVPQSQTLEDSYDHREDFTQTQQDFQKSYDNNKGVVAQKNPVPNAFSKPYEHSNKPNDFDAYKPDVEMIPKPDYEFIPKPDVEMIPDNGFTNDNDFTDYFPENNFDGYGDGYGDGAGDGIPSFDFKATAHQVRFSETTNNDNTPEILGGGGSIAGYKFDSVTNQFEPETIDISNRTEDMIIRAENSKYFSNAPSTATGVNVLTFKNLASGESVTIDGLTLTASGDLSAAEVAAGFSNLSAGAQAINISSLEYGSWSGELSAGWKSGSQAGDKVTFTSTAANSAIGTFVTSSTGSTPVDVAHTEPLSDVYLSRVLRFEPNMPEGFYVNSFTVTGLISGVKILDKEANELTTTNVSRDDMVFKDADGKVIKYDDADFLTTFKSVEFTIKYDKSIADPFDLSITANYKVDAAFADSTTEPEQSFTNEYTFALKDITKADDYTYDKSKFTNAKDQGFILSKETNENIIKDGSGNSVIYGGIGKDTVYDGAGDDTYYLGAGDDTLYGGSGTNRIYGDSDGTKEYEGEDTVSYENVNSFGVSEIELLSAEGIITALESQKLSGSYDEDGDPLTANGVDIDMLASYKGVYVDLDGVHVDGLNIDVNNDGFVDADDKINAISKFANRNERFTYDAKGYADGTSIGKTITFTSSTPNAHVDNIEVSGSAAVNAVDAPTALGINIETANAKNDITFQDLIKGQSVTVGGLILTATGDITAAAVAAGFASLAASATVGNDVGSGTWSGVLSAEWSSAAVTNTTVSFTSTIATTDITTSSAGVAGISGAEALDITTQEGGSDIDARQSEKTTIVFKDLTAGQSVSVGGLTLTANGAISALAVAAGFSELLAGATTGNAVSNGVWSGTLGDFSSSAQESGLDSIQATGYDIYEGIENIEGSNYNDTIYGNALKDNVLRGLDGSDTIDGRGGNNKLYGGDGSDTLISGSGKDYIDGGADTDTVSYINMSEGVTVRLDRPKAEEYDYAHLNSDLVNEKDRIINVENITGSDFDDIIYGNAGTNFIQGGKGNDKIYAGGGYDFIDGGEGSDWITYLPSDYDFNSTNNTFMEVFQGITVDLNSKDFVMVKETTTDNLIDLIKNIEQISATDGIDKIYGSSENEIFWGHGGNDIIWGRGGDDIIYGGSGDDYIRPGRGIDESYGGSGNNYLELYDDGLKDKTFQAIRLSETGVVEHKLVGGDGSWVPGYNSIDGLEIAEGFSGIGLANNTNDEIHGNELANVINGYGGDDDICGYGGDDTIRGGAGKDRIFGGAGNDIIYGDQDDDFIDAGDGDDTVYGYGRYNTNVSNNDTIDGGAGFDTINYSITSDALTLDMRAVDVNGYATAQFLLATGTAGIYDDKIKNFESIVGSRGADTIHANNSGMTLDGWSGVDKLYGGSGNDTIIARNTAGEILDGGGGIDTLNLAQNVNFRTIDVSKFETLELGSYNAYFNLSQWDDNDFSTIVGGDNSRIYLYGTNSDESFNFTNIDFSGFSGSLYVYGYNGNDTYDFTGSTLNSNMKYYLDAGGGSDTLVMGANQNIDMLDNYYNTFEKFTVGADSNLNVNAHNDSGRSFYAHNKDFSGVTGDVNLIGGAGNDTFYANYEALLAGKLNIDGKNGVDTVDVRTDLPNGSSLTFDSADIFKNIEGLKLDIVSNTNNISMDARAMDDWFSGDSITLNLANNNSQSSKITITNTQLGDMTDFMVNTEYTITPIDNDSFTMFVV